FYHCGNRDCPRVKFDIAVELFFKCPNCKGSLNMIDNTKIKEALRHKIDQVTTDINSNKK
ncbi:MAG: tfe, partial [Nitrososphaera sp.]|nr:tfe [Nitrososphaera sp.]